MIKWIIKRDGRTELFSPEKVNGWGEWGSKTLQGRVNWGDIVLSAVSILPETCTSEQLQIALIDQCNMRKTWDYSRMAGRLFASHHSKTIYGKKKPTVKELHTRMVSDGIMRELEYSDSDYEVIESMIDHRRDLNMAYYQIHQIVRKYALQNRVKKVDYETPQFTFMRLAMVLSEYEKDNRLEFVKDFYEEISNFRINVPTPYFTNAGTILNGYASCAVFTTDDSAESLLAGDIIGYTMTLKSAGLGAHVKTRSIGDPIRNGSIKHQGKVPYYRHIDAGKSANLQNGRGGAMTMFYSCYDPEIEKIQSLRNPMTPIRDALPGLNYAFSFNDYFARSVIEDTSIGAFSVYDNDSLYECQYDKDPDIFKNEYTKYINEGGLKNNSIRKARDILVGAITESFETGRHYLFNINEANRHTPFKDKIYSSNLCTEIFLPTKPYKKASDLYQPYNEDHGEIALCSLAGIMVANIKNDEQYAKTAYYCLKMIDYGIDHSDYAFPTLEHTAKSRRSAGVGIVGLAHLMAKKGITFDSQEGRNFAHELAETHFWHLTNASLRISQERGANAPWMSKTLWPEGWTPLSTYNRNVDSLVTVDCKRDWDSLSKRIVENGGIAHSVLVAHMPAESSSVAAGTTNGIYPVRELFLVKTNDTDAIPWVAPESGVIGKKYQKAFETHPDDMLKFYAVMQKFCDQGISADLWRDVAGNEKIGTNEMIRTFLTGWKYGVKSRYYFNLQTGKNVSLEDSGVECEGCAI